MSKVVFDADKVRKTIVVSLPSVPGSELEFYTNNIVGNDRELSAKYPKNQDKEHPDAFSYVLGTLVKLLKSWNLTDKDNNDISVSGAEEIFNAIPLEDLKFVMDKIEESKKETIGSLGLEQSKK